MRWVALTAPVWLQADDFEAEGGRAQVGGAGHLSVARRAQVADLELAEGRAVRGAGDERDVVLVARVRRHGEHSRAQHLRGEGRADVDEGAARVVAGGARNVDDGALEVAEGRAGRGADGVCAHGRGPLRP